MKAHSSAENSMKKRFKKKMEDSNIGKRGEKKLRNKCFASKDPTRICQI